MGPQPGTGVLLFITSVALSPLRTETPLLSLPHQGLLPPSSLFPRMSATATPVYLSPPRPGARPRLWACQGGPLACSPGHPPSAPIFAWVLSVPCGNGPEAGAVEGQLGFRGVPFVPRPVAWFQVS